MQGYVVVFSSLAVLFGLLCAERSLVHRLHRRIPVRIVVLGTRGKSGVVRLIASGLRAGGRRVLYKTTGAQPILGNVDGTERRIRRRGSPTPLEQRWVLYEAARQGADIAVVEAMSIRPESLRAEVLRILAPQLVVVTSVGRDHIADIEDPCAAFAAAIPASAIAITGTSAPPALSEALARRSIRVQQAKPSEPDDTWSLPTHEEWEANVQLAAAACARSGVPREAALRGMRVAIPDLGALRAWRLTSRSNEWIAVNGFAANDPSATRHALEHALARWGTGHTFLVGLLNLRRDRGDRTAQWLEALRSNPPWPFDRLVVAGNAPWLVRSRLHRTLRQRVTFVPSGEPERVMAAVTGNAPDGGLVFGFGNIGGIGVAMIEDWEKDGEAL